jgi:hypothetical protein
LGIQRVEEEGEGRGKKEKQSRAEHSIDMGHGGVFILKFYNSRLIIRS